jgi:acetyl-CoA carboxylase carboxyl transferase subunit alpha
VILDTFGRDPQRGPEAAEALRISADRTLELGAGYEVVREPLGGAHRDPAAAAALVEEAIVRSLARLDGMPADELVAARYRKYRGIGHFAE